MTDGIMAHLRSGHRLLILDNCEHLLAGAVDLLATVLAGCPALQLVATSRAPLHVSGEHEYPVPPLALPSTVDMTPEALADVPAVRLYVERAAAVDPSFRLTESNAAAVAAICTRLDGLPLAIELAAARSKVLPPALLLPRLARQLPLLTGGPRDVPARLQTMREAIVWSYDLLSADEQRLLARLAVFVGRVHPRGRGDRVCQHAGGRRSRPHAPSTLDGIASLVDKSLLLWRDATASGRLGMLETIREFALEQLAAAGEEHRARAAHAAYFATLDEWLEPNHVAPGERVRRSPLGHRGRARQPPRGAELPGQCRRRGGRAPAGRQPGHLLAPSWQPRGRAAVAGVGPRPHARRPQPRAAPAPWPGTA